MTGDASEHQLCIVDIRECPEHLESLAGWHQEEWAYLSPDKTLAQRISALSKHLETSFVPTTLVALGDSGPLGSASIIAHDMDTRPELSPWLACVFVAPAFRRKGIGSALVTEIVGRAAGRHLNKLYLFTPDQRTFYERLGWEILEDVAYRGTNVDIMEIDLRV